MGLLKTLKSLFGKKCDHDYVILTVKTEGFRPGTMVVYLSCKKCNSQSDTFHDLTETEDWQFRHPYVEELLFKQGYLEKKGKKVLLKTPQSRLKINSSGVMNMTISEEDVNLAIQLKNEKRYDEALSIYDSILAKAPNSELALVNKAILLKNMDRIGEALKIYDWILKKDPRNFGALANKGRALDFVHKYKEAIKFYDRALKIQPDNEIVQSNRKEALESLKSGKKQSEVEGLIETGLTACRLGDYDKAIKCLDEAIRLEPKNKDAIKFKDIALTNKATALIDKKQYTKALAILEKIRDSGKSTIHTYVNIGLCYEKMKKYDEALANYDSAMRMDPKDSTALNNKGFVLLLMGKAAEAIEYFDKSLKLSPHNLRAQNNRELALRMIPK